MFTLNLTVEDTKYLLEAQERMVDSIIHTLKNYYSENAEVIACGMAAMNGQSQIALAR